MSYCTNCGRTFQDGLAYCPNCGSAANGAVNYRQPGSYTLNADQQMKKDIETANTLGIVTLVCSILNFMSLGFGFLFAIVGIVTGIFGKKKIKEYMGANKQFPNAKAKSAYNLNKAGIIIIIIAVVLYFLFYAISILLSILGIGLPFFFPFLFDWLDELL